MRRKTCVVVLAVILIYAFGAVGEARAHFLDGHKLSTLYRAYEFMGAPGGAAKAGWDTWRDAYEFIGYIEGVWDAFSPVICFGDKKVSIGQISAIAGNYLKAHPAEWDQPGDMIVLRAYVEAYPCPKK
jgi:hypothetical protein